MPDRRTTFTFLVHPRTSIRADLGRRWPAIGLVPEPLLDRSLRHLPLPALPYGPVRVHPAVEPLGELLVVPATGRQLLTDPETGARMVARAVDRAVAMGAGVVGLGALTASVTRGGRTLGHRADVALTTGNAFTAAIIVAEVERTIADHGLVDPTVAVVGANGSVGSCASALLADRRVTGHLLLVGRRHPALTAVAEAVGARAPDLDVRTSTDMWSLTGADVVVLVTAATGSIIEPGHLAPEAVVIDGTQPRNTSSLLLRARPDVSVLDGGLVEVPGLQLPGDIGVPDGCAYACLAETMLCALDGRTEHFSLGPATPGQATHMLELARRHGFRLAPPHSFGRPIDRGVVTAGHRSAA